MYTKMCLYKGFLLVSFNLISFIWSSYISLDLENITYKIGKLSDEEAEKETIPPYNDEEPQI